MQIKKMEEEKRNEQIRRQERKKVFKIVGFVALAAGGLVFTGGALGIGLVAVGSEAIAAATLGGVSLLGGGTALGYATRRVEERQEDEIPLTGRCNTSQQTTEE